MMKIACILLGISVVVAIVLAAIGVWIIDLRIDRIDYIITNYKYGDKRTEDMLIEFLRKSGCVVKDYRDSDQNIEVQLGFLWKSKTWSIPRNGDTPNQSF